jgi:hypothetical protein
MSYPLDSQPRPNAVDSQELIRTVEVPPAAARTQEILSGDILDESPAVLEFASVLPPPRSPPRRNARPGALGTKEPRDMGPWIAGGIALGVLVSLSIAVVVRIVDARTPYPRTSVTVVQTPARTATASPSLSAAPLASAAASSNGPSLPSVRVDTLPIVPSTRGTLHFSPQGRGHRVFVDGIVVGEADAPLDVRCGAHSIKVGSHGEPHPVDVPCGGTVDVK